mgnify:CR=1 FL=1
MATKKELFNVKGVEMTAHEKMVFDKVVELARPGRKLQKSATLVKKVLVLHLQD